MQSRTDVRGQSDLVDRSYGGGCATRRGMERAMETKRRWAGCTQGANPIFSIAAIVASNPGDFGQGRVGARHTGASRSVTSSCLSCSPSSYTASSCRSLSSAEFCEPSRCQSHSTRKRECGRGGQRLSVQALSLPQDTEPMWRDATPASWRPGVLRILSFTANCRR